ncbi:MAG: hypothetical protein E6876_15610 [Clostridium sp.]|uniref:hypothetical protein n=1 Tax=Clostridium tertium TaxID=1559 RepID=UPI0022E33BFE|nr:hypothetical protein [Clostridium tertium]MDU1568631.1 hypothetical protein [Clostridium sp.]
MIKSRHTDEEKQQCVNEYLNGKDKYYLSGKYSTSIRTIDRWIKSSNIDRLKLRMIKRAKTIPVKIQEEILNVLNSNPICVGFNISYWKEFMIIDYIKNKYNIAINRRMAKGLIEDSQEVNVLSYEDKVINDIEELADLGYSIVLVDYIKIGKIASQEIEYKDYKEEMVDVNLVIARAGEDMYVDVIFSDLDIVDTINEVVLTKKDKAKRRIIANDKFEVLKKVCNEEQNDRVVFMTIYDRDMPKVIKKDNTIKWYIVESELYKTLTHQVYEGEHGKTVIEYIDDKNNRGRVYRRFTDIDNTIRGKIDKYVLNVTSDKIEYEKSRGNNECKKYNCKDNEDNIRKYIKILM